MLKIGTSIPTPVNDGGYDYGSWAVFFQLRTEGKPAYRTIPAPKMDQSASDVEVDCDNLNNLVGVQVWFYTI